MSSSSDLSFGWVMTRVVIGALVSGRTFTGMMTVGNFVMPYGVVHGVQ